MTASAIDTEALAVAMDAMHAVEEMARGYREYLKRNNWSETAAEQVAAAWLASLITQGMAK